MDQRVRSPGVALGSFAIFGCLLLALSGCGGLTADQRVNAELTKLDKPKLKVFPFGGKVTVDGVPAQSERHSQRVYVVLFDRAKPDLKLRERPNAACDQQGEFSFQTYVPNDGVAPGEYVVAIAQLAIQERSGNFAGRDELQNLYNDPDKNDNEPMFVIKHGSPGNKNYVFDLRVAGREPVSDPGPRAVTGIR